LIWFSHLFTFWRCKIEKTAQNEAVFGEKVQEKASAILPPLPEIEQIKPLTSDNFRTLLIPFIHAFMASIALNAKGSVILEDGFPPYISFTNLHYKHLISSQPLCNQSPFPF